MTTAVKMSIMRLRDEITMVTKKLAQAAAAELFHVALGDAKKLLQKPTGPRIATAEAAATASAASYKSYRDLQTRLRVLKAALHSSNSTAKVSIGGVEITVTEALAMRDSLLEEEIFLVAALRQAEVANNQINLATVQMETQISKRIEQIVASPAQKLDADTQALVRKGIEAESKPILIEPEGLLTSIVARQSEVENLLLTLKFTLNESNAQTTVEV